MPDPKTCLDLPFGPGDFRGALYEPLLPFKLRYRHGPIGPRTLPWIRTRHPEPFTHWEACEWIRKRYDVICQQEWMEQWERAANAWRCPDRPVAWPYIRVSHAYSAASGLSFEMQLERILAFWKELGGDDKFALGPVFSDPEVSGQKVRFRQRRGGAELMRHARRGDAILFYCQDRSARLVVDSATLLRDVWQPAGILPYFVLERLDLSTPAGVAMYHNVATFAQFSSDQLSQKCKDVAAAMKATGRAYNNPPYGFRIITRKGKKYFAPEPQMMIVMARIEHLRDTLGMSWGDVAEKITEEIKLMIVEKNYNLPARIKDRVWQKERCKVTYTKWKKMLADGFAKRPDKYQLARDERGLDD